MNENLKQMALHSPAFPPQLAQDKFGQLVAPVPGMTKLEYAVITLTPAYIAAGYETDAAVNEAINAAIELLSTCTLRKISDTDESKPNLSIS